MIRVTTDDLDTGERTVIEIDAGDYTLIACPPCHVAHVTPYPLTGCQIVTIKGHKPSGRARIVEVNG